MKTSEMHTALVGMCLIIGLGFAAHTVFALYSGKTVSVLSFIFQSAFSKSSMPILYWVSIGLNMLFSTFFLLLIRKVPSTEDFLNYEKKLRADGRREPKPLFKFKDKK